MHCSDPCAAVLSLARYDPNRGYHWEFPGDTAAEQNKKDTRTTQLRHDEPEESQRRRVDTLLSDLLKKFPPKIFAKKVKLKLANDTIIIICVVYRMEENQWVSCESFEWVTRNRWWW